MVKCPYCNPDKNNNATDYKNDKSLKSHIYKKHNKQAHENSINEWEKR